MQSNLSINYHSFTVYRCGQHVIDPRGGQRACRTGEAPIRQQVADAQERHRAHAQLSCLRQTPHDPTAFAGAGYTASTRMP